MKRLLFIGMSLAMALWGQTTSRVVPIRYIEEKVAVQAAQVVGFGRVNVVVVPTGVLVTGPPELVEAAVSALKQIDQRQKNVEATFYVIAASAANGTPLPPELASVGRQLEATFHPGPLRLIESLQIRVREGASADASGVVGKGPNGTPNIYQLRVQQTNVDADPTRPLIRLTGLKFGARIAVSAATASPAQIQYVDAGFNTNVDIEPGQKVVIGKASLDTSSSPYFVVLSAKVVD